MSLTARQLEIRLGGVTATDVVALSGMSPHGRTAHDVYCEKLEIAAPWVASDEAEIGEVIEPVVIRRLAKTLGLHVLRRKADEMTIVHPEHPTRVATPDAFFATTAFTPLLATGQVKVVGAHKFYEWGPDGEEPPDWVSVQCTWEGHVARVPVVHVGALLGTEVRAYTVAVAGDLLEALIEVADRFWTDHVLAQRPPPIDGSAGSGRMLKSLFPRARLGPSIPATPEAEEAARAYFAFRAQAKAADAELEGAKQALIAACGDAPGITGNGWRLLRGMRKGYTVTPEPYTVPEGRGFDLRAMGKR